MPSADDVAASLDRAARSLAEIKAREAADDQTEADHRAAELTRWHADDTTDDYDGGVAADGWEAGDQFDDTADLDPVRT